MVGILLLLPFFICPLDGSICVSHSTIISLFYAIKNPSEARILAYKFQQFISMNHGNPPVNIKTLSDAKQSKAAEIRKLGLLRRIRSSTLLC